MRKIVLFVAILLALTMCFTTAKAVTQGAIDSSIAKGLAWLAGQQNPADGSWGTYWQVGETGLAVKKFEHWAIERGINPLDTTSWPPDTNYYHQVKWGLNYLFSKACILPIAPQPAGNPDSDGDGIGVYFVSPDCYGFYRTYETGIALMAIAESNCPDSGVNVPGSPVNTWTYRDVAVDAVDYLAFGQNDAGGERGGWGYYENYDSWSDNSNTGYAVLGLAYAEEADPRYGFNIPVPTFVKDELNIWIGYIQCDPGDPDAWTADKDGGSGYSNAWYGGPCGTNVNTLKTGNLLLEMAFCGELSGTRRDRAIHYLVHHWSELNSDPGWQGSYQAMYCIMKGLEVQGLQTIDGIDWFDSLATYIVTHQNPDSSWGPCPEGDPILCTEWALLTLQKVSPPPPPTSKVIIPNKVYERFGYAHWIYPDTGIYMDDACEPYHGVNPGDFFEIPIILKDVSVPIGGFELEVDYDYIDLTFYGAEPGRLLSQRWYTPTIPDSTLWSWEYFTYRILPCPTCACCKYKILLYGQAEIPDGLFRRGYCLVADGQTDSTYWGVDSATYIHKDGTHEKVEVGATLVWLKFQVANNELLRDLKLPIVFEWEHKLSPNYPYHIVQDWDCAENTMSDCKGERLFVSKDTMQYDPHVCPYLPSDQRILNFVDGGVHICSICTAFVCVRGDVNMDGNAYTTADAVMLARALIFGAENVFTINLAKQKCATDANADGRTMMLSDLIYLIRVIQHDATPLPKLGPSSDIANVVVSDGRITVECASAIGGLLFEFDGKVNPTLLNTDMELLSKEGKVLVWSSEGNSINAGASEILSVTGAQLVSVIAVDREGRDLATTINAKVTPTTFALHPAYPNPFNPYTNLSFTLPNAVFYSMNIYNVAGQLVKSYEGMGTVGLNVITWDGKNNAGNDVSSGIYFCKFSAGSFSATNKMVMLK
jgi:hypothetical protein